MFSFRPLATLVRFLTDRAAEARSRRELLSLDDRILRDIGITREQALRAVLRPFWRPSRVPMADGRRRALHRVRKAARS